MSPFKSRPRAACAALALAFAVVCSRVALHRHGPPADRGEQVEHLLRQLEEHGVHLHVVSAAASGDRREGIYLCTAPSRRENLEALPHTPEALPRWKGIVFVGRYYPVYEEEVLSGAAAIIGRCRLFGDPETVAHIRKALGARPAVSAP